VLLLLGMLLETIWLQVYTQTMRRRSCQESGTDAPEPEEKMKAYCTSLRNMDWGPCGEAPRLKILLGTLNQGKFVIVASY
jgi:hypothetical protein